MEWALATSLRGSHRRIMTHITALWAWALVGDCFAVRAGVELGRDEWASDVCRPIAIRWLTNRSEFLHAPT